MKKRGQFGMFFGVTMLSLVATGAHPAFAAPPPACETETLQRMYEVGYQNGQSLLQRAWGRVNNCRKLRDFREIVRSTFAEATVPTTSMMVACRMSGMHDGYYDTIAAIDSSCRTCVLQQDWAVGDYAAHTYCALGGLSIPVERFSSGPRRVCGAAARMQCRRQFDQSARNTCGELMSTNPPDRFRSLACTGE
ncbi:hypothetical protein [Polyangium sp. 15x6]|uniref:hypothetical protein n=1 Tax=Polyangium sp. 15x6 TaxID=3042687 RepID=UPI00249ADE6E|nr:hypothetical protein [Polyangium sp. 15x6]MDI3287990.1 hypothetical protein [Polyangium sp. 15x6]